MLQPLLGSNWINRIKLPTTAFKHSFTDCCGRKEYRFVRINKLLGTAQLANT